MAPWSLQITAGVGLLAAVAGIWWIIWAIRKEDRQMRNLCKPAGAAALDDDRLEPLLGGGNAEVDVPVSIDVADMLVESPEL